MFVIKSSTLKSVTKRFMNNLKTFRVNNYSTQINNSSDSESKNSAQHFDDDNLTPEVEEAIEKIENFKLKVQSMRDVSRLTRKKPIINNFSMPYIVKTLRPIDTKSAWSKVEAKIEEEKTYDLSFEQKIKIFIEKKQQEIDDYKKKEKDVDDALARQPKQIEAYYQRLIKKEESDVKRVGRQEEILNMAREHFGYDVDLREPKVRDLIKKLEDDRKKDEKSQKKEKGKKVAKSVVNKENETESKTDANNEENEESKPSKSKKN